MLIAPAGEWHALADHLEKGIKIKSSAQFLQQGSRRQKCVDWIRECCGSRIETAQVGIQPNSPTQWDGSEERSILTEAKHLKLTEFRLAQYFWDEGYYGHGGGYKSHDLDYDTLAPLKFMDDKLSEHRRHIAGCFQRVCFALDPNDKEGGAGGGIDDYAGNELVLRLLADAHRLAIDLQDLGKYIYAQACERGL